MHALSVRRQPTPQELWGCRRTYAAAPTAPATSSWASVSSRLPRSPLCTHRQDRGGRQELEIKIGSEHISFTCAKIGSLLDVQDSPDPDGLRIFYYLVQVANTISSLPALSARSFVRSLVRSLVHAFPSAPSPLLRPGSSLTLTPHPPPPYLHWQDLKCFIFSLISLHFKIKPIP